MDKKTGEEIIAFAIEKEKQAVDFYQRLQKQSAFTAHREMLADLERMEKGHITALENMRESVEEQIKSIPDVQDLKISDYLVESEPAPDMSYQDIIITAMKREEQAAGLYSSLAELTTRQDTKNLFLRLAAEEKKHKLHFEKIYDDEILKDN